MPELPEVQTTVNGLNKKVKGRKIVDVSTSYNSKFYKGKDEIKNPEFFKIFKKKVKGKKILKAERRAKNILIHLSGGHTILIHLKMTGHLVYGRPLTRFVRLDFTLSNKTHSKYRLEPHLVLSDMRKFAKVTYIETTKLEDSTHLRNLGPEPLENKFDFKTFKSQILKRPRGKIKPVLMDQNLIAGIGNIYADEILWQAGVHPLSCPVDIPDKELHKIFKDIKQTLKRGVALGGDSMDDYRNIDGEKGKFQYKHRAYQKDKTDCTKAGCVGIIKKIRVASRGTHFCPKHQLLYDEK